MSGNVNPYKPPGMIFAWAFHPVNPWRERFDPYLVFILKNVLLGGNVGLMLNSCFEKAVAYDTGLRSQWIKRARYKCRVVLKVAFDMSDIDGTQGKASFF